MTKVLADGKTSTLHQGNSRFHRVHPGHPIGTASDRYAGWDRSDILRRKIRKRNTRRTHRSVTNLLRKKFSLLKSVREYFEHFPLLEIDYTFYRRSWKKTANPHRISCPQKLSSAHEGGGLGLGKSAPGNTARSFGERLDLSRMMLI